MVFYFKVSFWFCSRQIYSSNIYHTLYLFSVFVLFCFFFDFVNVSILANVTLNIQAFCFDSFLILFLWFCFQFNWVFFYFGTSADSIEMERNSIDCILAIWMSALSMINKNNSYHLHIGHVEEIKLKLNYKDLVS